MSQHAQTMAQPPEKEHETERLAALVRGLEEECEKLRRSLASVKADRDRYQKIVYANARGSLHFEGVDIPELEQTSGGPVQTLE
jgi:hypothetical protein